MYFGCVGVYCVYTYMYVGIYLCVFVCMCICMCIFLFVCMRLCLSEKAMSPHSSNLAWKIPWMEEPGELQSMGSLRVGHD